MTEYFKEWFFDASNTLARLRGIAPDHREMNSVLADSMRRFDFLNRYSDDFSFPTGVIVDGSNESTCYRLAFTNWASSSSLEVCLTMKAGDGHDCRLDVAFLRYDRKGSCVSPDGGWFDVADFCSVINLNFHNEFQAGSDASARVDAILETASHVLTNQVEFCLADGNWVWLKGDTLRGSHASRLVEGVIGREYLRYENREQTTLLTRVLGCGRLDLMEMLLAHGVPLGQGGLSIAMTHWYVTEHSIQPWVDRLISAGANVDEVSGGSTPLGCAANHNDVPLVKHLLKIGAKRVLPAHRRYGVIDVILTQALGPYWTVDREMEPFKGLRSP